MYDHTIIQSQRPHWSSVGFRKAASTRDDSSLTRTPPWLDDHRFFALAVVWGYVDRFSESFAVTGQPTTERGVHSYVVSHQYTAVQHD